MNKEEIDNSFKGQPLLSKELSQAGMRFELFKSIKDVPSHWDAIGDHDIFLEKNYLTTLENFPPKGMFFYYLIFKKGENPIGKCIFQIQHFNAKESIRTDGNVVQKDRSEGMGSWLKNFVANKVNFHGMVCGNLLMTGEHGFIFEKDCTEEEQHAFVKEAIDLSIETIQKQGTKIALVLVKDFFDEHKPLSQPFLSNGYSDFAVQPNMIMHLRPEWKSFDDYLAAMSSKYRVRCKRAFKKAAGITKKNLSLEEIEESTPRIFQLYSAISDGAGFNLFKLNPDYFAALKRNLGPDFNLYGYYKDDELVGFYTTIKNGKHLDAHFLGLDHAANRAMQLYLNILYEIVDLGIQLKCEDIIFSRTAIEIKSSVGAQPFGMYTLMKHRNKMVNKYLAPKLVDYLSPKDEYTIRKPFK